MGIFLDNFLLALPALDNNEFFANSISYICDYSEDKGTMAFVLDKPLLFTLEDLFKQINLPYDKCLYKDINLMRGGPVHAQNGFVLHEGAPEWDSSFRVKENLSVTTSLDILDAIANNRLCQNFMVFLGISMWQPGQLENELNLNAWLTYPADNKNLFETPKDQLRKTIAKKIGIDLDNISPWIAYV